MNPNKLILHTVSGGRRVRTPPLPPGKRFPLLSPSELERYKNLYTFTKMRVEGHLSGRHKSPFQGSSSDFADYHEYSPGQDVSRIDWRVYGRSRRLYVRRFEEETDMAIYLLVDVSASMNYGGSGRMPKFIHAARLAAAIAYLAVRQRDKVALGLVGKELRNYCKAGGSRLHLQNLLQMLESVYPAQSTSLATALHNCAEVFRRRGRLVLISDFHDDLDAVLDALGHFRHRGFEIQLYQILDPDELKLPRSAAVEFIDMENHERVRADIDEIRKLYMQRIQDVIRRLGDESVRRHFFHHLVNPNSPLHSGLEAYLNAGKRPPSILA
ncbi:DUF58 domain-containing protein [Coraliomargarita parva]|uniref:DUF58 domain-containing protein n=1 Tax=Coraliomargarita parva TaxID=3014050 RepID=UPI0022B33D4B|nr:DUF58 domain-containing protein [Coraliomargarita parva]